MGFDPLLEYSRGLQGCRKDPRADEEFADSVIRAGGNPDGDAVAHQWEFAGLGAGKLTATWMHVVEQFPGCWPGAPQEVGDCFVAGTMVTMGDGTLKPIEDVKTGDFVLSPTGMSRKVLSTIKKPYSGDILSVKASHLLDEVRCTPDHRFMSPVNDYECKWVDAASLSSGSVLLPDAASGYDLEHTYDLHDYGFTSNPNETAEGLKSEPRRMTCPDDRVRAFSSKSDCPRRIKLDSEFAWFVGLYLAEGSCDKTNGSPRRITLNLGGTRRDLAERAAAFLDSYGIASTISSVPSKPTVLYVRVSNIPFATLVSEITGNGNTYTKSVPPEVMSSSDEVRAAFLKGWMDGDGWYGEDESASHRRAVGVSVNKAMIRDMQRIAMSVGMPCSMTSRKPHGRSKRAYQIQWSGKSAADVTGRQATAAVAVASKLKKVANGYKAAVKSVTSESWSGTVYCIEVDEDHAFIANGFGVHNCVSHGCKNACLTSFGCELAEGKPDEVTGKVEGKPDIPQAGITDGVLSTEAIYWWRYPQSRGMDGWVCSSAAKEVTTNAGLWLRKPYPDFDFDLTKYSASNIKKFYGRRPPDNVRDYGRQYLIRTATNVRGREQVRDFLAAGYGVFFCSGLGWSNTRNEDGVSYTRGGWAHSQAWIGYDDRPETIRKYREPLVCVLNSWGRWNKGPRKVMGTNLEIPEGAYWTPASTIDRCSGISLSSVAGWPPRKLKTYGADGNI